MSEAITVLGAGSWGMAIAQLLSDNGHQVTLWEFDQDEYKKLVEKRTIDSKLKNFRLHDSIQITNDFKTALLGAQLLVSAVPSQSLRSVARNIPKLSPGVGIVNLSKGIETSSLLRMSEVILDAVPISPDMVATLSGPSHAEEVVAKMPTTVVVASPSESFSSRLQSIFSNDNFRVYGSNDLTGVELGGSLKNIIAIASGITVGLKMGDNTNGALLTRGLAEITRLGVALGARSETFAGLSGIGDLITTCNSRHSRNRYVGEWLGKGKKLNEILDRMSMVAEGVQTTKSGVALAKKLGVEMPIAQAVYDMLFEDKDPSVAVGELMGRSLKTEVWY